MIVLFFFLSFVLSFLFFLVVDFVWGFCWFVIVLLTPPVWMYFLLFFSLVCFAVGVRCASEFVTCFVFACKWLEPFCLHVSGTNLLLFAVVVAHSRTCTDYQFVHVFALFLLHYLLMHPSAPVRTDLYPSAPIRVTFCRSSQNMMSGEISPTIWLKSWSEIPYIPPDCLDFVYFYLILMYL